MGLLTQVSNLAKSVSDTILLPNFAKVLKEKKPDGSWLTVADTLAHQALVKELPLLVDYPVLSEELTEQQQQQIVKDRHSNYWCVDPLDGTSNFAQGIPYWCVSIALIEYGRMVLGVVYDPNRNECFAATEFSSTTLNGHSLEKAELESSEIGQSMGLIDFKRLDDVKASALVINPPYRSQRSFGASALDLCWIAANRCQVYLHGKQQLWDHAAGLLILKNANGCAETFEGDSIFDNSLKPKTVIAASNGKLMQQWKSYFSD